MGRIRILSDQVANQIAAGEVVERPASVVKELLENSLDAGASRIRVDVEAGGRKLIRVEDDGCGMLRDDALLAFERHATSKIHSSDDLLSLTTLGFRGEALPSIASVARVHLTTRSPDEVVGMEVEIAGGKIQRTADAAIPPGTTLTIRDLFFNTPARRKFLKSEQTELSHVAALVTHYALAHPEKHFALHTATHALLEAPPVRQISERVYQIFGREVLEQLVPVAAETNFAHAGVPEPPPWKREPDWQPQIPGALRLHGFVSRPELQKLNRNSIYIFVNRRLIRDRLIQHAITEAYRNILPPTSFPVVLLFLEMPPEEVDVNVHPAKTEVRFRQQSFIHDFVRDSVRHVMVKARPAASFLTALTSNPGMTPSLVPDVSPMPGPPDPAGMKSESDVIPSREDAEHFALAAPMPPAQDQPLPFATQPTGATGNNGAFSGNDRAGAAQAMEDATNSSEDASATLHSLASLRALGQLKDSFILAANDEGLWIIDQHVAHERVLFEKILRERHVEQVQRQRLLMPVLIDLKPEQMPVFATIAEELERNGFEAEPFGPRTLAVKAVPVALEGRELERMLHEVLEQTEREQQAANLETLRTRIAASIACHAAIKINTPLDPAKIEWLLAELAKTEHPTSCPHGRPIALRYSLKDIQRAFQRI
ncbi:MAG TPA: DNA mismatch repair endonuclease MutL [Acidobacteriaceae bacterium]|jgi:DNA mismatch repair protein MutL|nr:DNA mismatch repair endonuclease MutL [Acidobacteriaceae bacterium]